MKSSRQAVTPFQTMILVPQGAEYQAVLRGLRRSPAADLIPTELPIGPQPVARTLRTLQAEGRLQSLRHLVLMGLGGSLVPELGVGAVTLVRGCVRIGNLNAPPIQSDRDWSTQLQSALEPKVEGVVTTVSAVTSDRLVVTPQEKAHLAQTHAAAIVEMEGHPVLQLCQTEGLKGAIIRVVSDDCQAPLPDVSAALTPEGTLATRPLAIALLRQPQAALRLIRGSLVGLRQLERAACGVGDAIYSRDRNGSNVS